jgi:hypothetical protein
MWSDYATALPWRVTDTRPPSPPEGLSKASADPAQDKSAGHTTADPTRRDGTATSPSICGRYVLTDIVRTGVTAGAKVPVTD